MNPNTQLTPASEFDTSNVVFSKATSESIPGAEGMTYHRIMINYRNPDNSIGELIVPTEELFSFGVSENTSAETGKVTGYSFPLCLSGRDGATPEEETFIDMVNNFVEHTKKHLLQEEVKESLERYELEPSDLKKLNPLYYKKVKGKIVEGTGPVLYAKLFVKKNKKTGELSIRSVFYEEGTYDEDGEPKEIPAVDLIGAYNHARAAVKFESIYSGGGKERLQVKLVEADVRVQGKGQRRLLRSKKTVTGGVGLEEKNNVKPAGAGPADNKEDELEDSDDETVKKPTSVLRKKVSVKKTGVKKGVKN